MPTKAEALAELARRGVHIPTSDAKLTEDQGKSQDYARQMATTEQQYLAARRDGFDPSSFKNAAADLVESIKVPFMGAPLAGLGPVIRDNVSDRGKAAERAWLDSRLKSMTGAGQSEQESTDNPKTYFPTYGEDPETYRQKYDTRTSAYESVRRRAGPAGADLPKSYPNPANLPPRLGDVPTLTPEQVRAAPSGTKYRTVDGRTGTRP